LNDSLSGSDNKRQGNAEPRHARAKVSPKPWN
jgi:hypothetical protein